ncbi:MAG: hypothetical protein KDA65_17660, partial [Planctomycetaceae bacterium]|nr:hypothetical protein [Planctomycetaceae bacterium]
YHSPVRESNLVLLFSTGYERIYTSCQLLEQAPSMAFCDGRVTLSPRDGCESPPRAAKMAGHSTKRHN